MPRTAPRSVPPPLRRPRVRVSGSRARPWKAVRLGGAVFGLIAGIVACTPEIGDTCVVSTDCSIRGDRLCDISQPGGYCTQLNCQRNNCADEAACILFSSAVPGCGYDDRSGPFGSRIARSFCMAKCSSNGDCRTGYVCADPRSFPWNAVILDDDQGKRACLAVPLEGQDAGVVGPAPLEAPVCGPAAPQVTPIDAGAVRIAPPKPAPLFPDAGSKDAGGKEAGVDGG